MRNGMLFGFLGGFGLGAVIVGNIVGFPEVEVGEGVAAGAGGIGVLILVGDSDQLPSVGPGRVLRYQVPEGCPRRAALMDRSAA